MAFLGKHPQCGNWFARYRNAAGVRVTRSTKTKDRQTAQKLADAWEHAEHLARRGTLTADRTRAILSETLERVTGGEESIRAVAASEVFASWLAHKAATKAESSARRYRATVAQFLGYLGERTTRPLTAIRTADVQSFLDGRSKTRSTGTVSVDRKILSAGFAFARKQGLIDRNPVDAVELPKVQSNERSGFTADQVRILVESATGDWKTAILLGYFTGARLSDIVNLSWHDVGLAAGTLSYRQRKTSEKVILPLHPEALTHLESIA
ncbi:MAG: hypothetical protein EXS36_20010, partial [Pedosphaera sp.]|nr:hypothetical protein [Pedosphaera sp.]